MAEKKKSCIIAWKDGGSKGILLKEGEYCPVIDRNGLFQFEVCVGSQEGVKKARINPEMGLTVVDAFFQEQGFVKVSPIDCGLFHC